MNIADIIAALTGGASPDKAVLQGANAAVPPSGPPPQPAAPAPQPNAPQGVQTPVTNPQPATAAPAATQSPPDLANMYLELMRKSQNAHQLDSGLSLIAAGLSNSPTNRAALINSAGGGSGGMSLSANDLINFQKQADAQRQQLIMQQALPALMKQYKMTPAQIQALQASGQLGEVLKHYSEENLAQVTDANGQVHMVAPRTGNVIATIGSEKPDETMEVTRPDGSKVLVKKETGEPVKELAPRESVGDKIISAQNELAAINADRAARGEKPMTPEELIKLKQSPPTQINVGTDGSMFPKPDTGYDYERGADGKVLVDPVTHRPKLYKIEGGGPADEAAQKAKEEAKKLTDAEKLDNAKKMEAHFAASNVGRAADIALTEADKPGATGFGSRWARALSPGGTPADNVDAALSTLKANVAFKTLADMRNASKTGGALGQVSDFEEKMLSNVFGSLDTYQGTDNFKSGVARVKAAMLLLADDNFNKDPAKFEAALKTKTDEILAKDYSSKNKVTVRPRTP